MKGFLKYGIVPVIVFWGLLTITMMVLPLLINVAQYAPLIEKRISAMTGHQVSIGDDLAVTFFPWLSVSFSSLRLANPPGYSNVDFLTADTVEAQIAVLPLFHREIRFKRVVIGGLDMQLEVNPAGQRNWQDQEDGRRSWGEVLENLLAKVMGEDCLFVVTDGAMHWRERMSTTSHSVKDLMLLVNGRNNEENNAREVEFKATLAGQPFSATGTIGMEGYTAKELPIALDISLGELLQGSLQGKMAPSLLHPALTMQVVLTKVQTLEMLLTLVPSVQFLPKPFFLPDMKLNFAVVLDDNLMKIKDGTAFFAEDQRVLFSGVRHGGGKTKLEFEAQSSRLRLQTFLVPDLAADKTLLLDLPDWWYDSDIQGKIVVDDLAVGEQAWQHCQVDFRTIGDGAHLVVPLACEVGGGTTQAELLFRRQEGVDDLSINLKIRDIAVQELLGEVGVHNLTGRATGEFTVAVENDVQTEVHTPSWQGEGTINLANGQFAGINLWPAATAENIGGDAKEQAVFTPYDRIASRFRVENGFVLFDDLKVSHGDQTLGGHGTLSLARRLLDLELQRSDGRYVLTGGLAEPELYPENDERLTEIRVHQLQQADVQTLVDEKLPSPAEEDVRNLVGKPLIAPEVVAERFGLQPEMILSNKEKKKLPIGSGIIKIHPLQQESTR